MIFVTFLYLFTPMRGIIYFVLLNLTYQYAIAFFRGLSVMSI